MSSSVAGPPSQLRGRSKNTTLKSWTTGCHLGGQLQNRVSVNIVEIKKKQKKNPIYCGFQMCGGTRCCMECFLLAGFQRQTCSPRLSPLPFAQEKAHLLATLPPLSLGVVAPLYLSFIKTSQAPKSFATFSENPLLDPRFCTSSLKITNTLSFTVRSRLNAAWSYHRQHFAKAPGWCEAAARPAPGPCTVGQVKAYPGLALASREQKQNKNVKLQSKTKVCESTRTKMELQIY